MEDIKIKDENGKFRLRVSGMIIKNNKLLVHETQKFKGYCLPGGHVEVGESTKQAILREMKEELKINVKIITFIKSIVKKVLRIILLPFSFIFKPSIHSCNNTGVWLNSKLITPHFLLIAQTVGNFERYQLSMPTCLIFFFCVLLIFCFFHFFLLF